VFVIYMFFSVQCILTDIVHSTSIDRSSLIVVTLLASTVGAAAFIPLHECHGAFVCSALYWSGSAAVPVLSAQLATTTPRGALGRALGLVFGAYFFGNILGSPLAGPIAATIGLRGTIALAVGAFALSAALVFGITGSAPIRERARFKVSRTYWTLLFITHFASVLSIVSIALFPVYLRDVAA